MTQTKLFTSTKSAPVNILSDEGWTVYQSEASDGDNVEKFRKSVGVLYRCVQIRSNAVRKMPWRITGVGDAVLWESKERRPPANLLWAKNLRFLLGMTEAALILKSEAFWQIERNRAKVLGLRWLAPISMTPKWSEDAGLTSFERRLSAMRKVMFPPEEILYTWIRDPMHESRPDQPPAGAALSAAGVLYNANLFTSGFFERGAIKATLLTVKGNPQQAEKDRLKAWWNRFFRGVKNAGNAEVVSADVVPVVVGEGIAELSNTDLTGENREEIATTLGIPHSMVFSNASNFATASQDKLNFYDETVIPECDIIADSLNDQLFVPLGLQFEFLPETLDIYQEDEAQRADAFSKYVGAGMKQSIAAEILGVELPSGVEYADLDEGDEPAPVPPQLQSTGQNQDINQDIIGTNSRQSEQVAERRAADLDKWRRKAAKRLEGGKAALCEFESPWLSPLEIAYVRSRLVMADSKAAVDVAFRAEQEGGAGQGFFIDGRITPESYKAMLLRLDAEDNEAERTIRMAVEQRAERNLRKAFTDMRETLIPTGSADDDPNEIAARIQREWRITQELQDALTRALQDGADLGVSVVAQQMENTLSFGFDWTMANEKATAWVSSYAPTIIRDLDETGQRRVQQALTRWIANGEALEWLINDLEPVFGRRRSQMIASTEITRAYAEATRIAYRESGVVKKLVWQTANDERRCSYCGALHGKTTGLDGKFSDTLPARLQEALGDRTFEIPPAHPSCRCWISAEVI